jgi:hypothetical protein
VVDNRPVNPKINDVWVTDAGVVEYYDGTTWVRYLSPPDSEPVLQPLALPYITPSALPYITPTAPECDTPGETREEA